MRAASVTPRLLSRAEAAAYLGVAPATLDKAVLAGQFPAPLRIGVRNLFDRAAIDAKLDSLSGLTAPAQPAADLEPNEWDEVLT
jgi:predicted DNA-binding transcriptional regulator AlpA